MLEAYRFINRFRVAFFEIDMLRHVNHIAYVRWAETARLEYFATVLGEDITGARGCIAAKLVVDYRAPIEYRDDVAVGCRTTRFGTKSFEHEYEVWSESRELLACRMVMTLVAYDYTRNSSVAVPAEWRDRVAAFEPLPVP